MNILFYTTFEVSPEKGGTERITSTIATELQNRYRINCFSAYSHEIDPSFNRTYFCDKIKISLRHQNLDVLYRFITEHHIDFIINQGEFAYSKLIYELKQSYPQLKYIFAHHFNPGAEKYFMLHTNIIQDIKKDVFNIRNYIRLFIYPILKMRYLLTLRSKYKETYQYSDKIVLLSHKFTDEFVKYARLKENKKITAINNALSFKYFYDMSSYHNKKKVVLVVTRLEEKQKRISLILKIWKAIENKKEFNEWCLKIVGHGSYETTYKRYVQTNHLKRVFFEGIQSPETYYNEASIFMMTSSYEGWGLTLTEAQQYACIPLAFNSYASLSDIIDDKINGYIIENNNVNEYINKMSLLMQSYDLRKEMAANAVKSSMRFKINTICDYWICLLNELKTTKVNRHDNCRKLL